MSDIRTTNMWLVYVDEQGDEHRQPWQDLVESGTLIDPETGDDMQIVGWMTEEVIEGGVIVATPENPIYLDPETGEFSREP